VIRLFGKKLIGFAGERATKSLFTGLLCIPVFLFTGCQPQAASISAPAITPSLAVTSEPEIPLPTPFPTRPSYGPGELVDYSAQTGDTLSVVAIRFNTTVAEILAANTFIPPEATTLPPGMPMQIPIYFEPFWGSPFQIVPDSRFVNGPSQIDFDTQTFVDSQPGWLRTYSTYAGGAMRTGAGVIDYVAQNFSVSPQFLLAVLEYQTRALTQETRPQYVDDTYLLGHESQTHKGLYLQLVWAANLLNDGYYGWRTGRLTSLDLVDGTIEIPDPWQNAATVALQNYYAQNLTVADYRRAISAEGFSRVFIELFGDPWAANQPHIPGSLQQPEFQLPFESGRTWAYTGGPHTGWGTGYPWAAIDFAPPSQGTGCYPSTEWATAIAAGLIARTDVGVVELDLDGDGDVRTGWVVFYLHLAAQDRIPAGRVVAAGDRLGHPSCEGGTSTGTHIHIARKYNGEWIPAVGTLAFNLEGWITHGTDEPYEGSLNRFSQRIYASPNAVKSSYITSEIE